MYRVIITATPLSSTSNKKLSTSAHIKLGLMDSNDDFGEEISIDNEYDNYMVLSHCAYAEISMLTFWQFVLKFIFNYFFKPLAWILGVQTCISNMVLNGNGLPSNSSHFHPLWVHIFSSSSETMTKRCNHIKLELMEALQMLKFMLKNERLHFMENWKTPIGNMMANPDDENNTLQHILGVKPTEVEELLEHLMGEEGPPDEDPTEKD
jgi:hypothetical protein